jgi:CBS domain-containing protein
MAQSIREVMTPDPRTVAPSDSLADAARQMREGDTGAILVADGGRLVGILTDRDIVVRVVAEGGDPSTLTVGDVATRDVRTLTVDQSVDDAIRLVREHDVRRIPVMQDGRPAGVVSIGDLAIERDPDSALADVSSEPPNN